MKVFISSLNGVLDGLEEHVETVPDWQHADTLVLWQDVLGDYPKVTILSQKAGKKVFVAEHGMLSINDYIPPLNRPLLADKFMAWGKKTRDFACEKGNLDPDKFVITGSLIFRRPVPRVKHSQPTVLYAPRHWGIEIQENLDISQELQKMNVYKISKIVDREHNPKDYPNPVTSARTNKNHIETCYDLISRSDVVVTIGESTFGALAHFVGVPVISVEHWHDKELLGKLYTKENFFEQVSDATIRTDLAGLQKTVMKVLKNPDIKEKERKIFLRDWLNLPCDPLKNMLEVING